jgi:ribosome-associated protein
MKQAPLADRPIEMARIAAAAADSKKARDVLILEVGPLIVITDYFVIATGGNPRQIQTIAREVSKQVTEAGGEVWHTDGLESAHWVLMDCGSVVVHIFTPETRALYDLEHLWADAARVDFTPPGEAGREE